MNARERFRREVRLFARDTFAPKQTRVQWLTEAGVFLLTLGALVLGCVL